MANGSQWPPPRCAQAEQHKEDLPSRLHIHLVRVPVPEEALLTMALPLPRGDGEVLMLEDDLLPAASHRDSLDCVKTLIGSHFFGPFPGWPVTFECSLVNSIRIKWLVPQKRASNQVLLPVD